MNGHSYGIMVRDDAGRTMWVGEGSKLTINTAQALRWETQEDAREAAKFITRRLKQQHRIGRLNGRD